MFTLIHSGLRFAELVFEKKEYKTITFNASFSNFCVCIDENSKATNIVLQYPEYRYMDLMTEASEAGDHPFKEEANTEHAGMSMV